MKYDLFSFFCGFALSYLSTGLSFLFSQLLFHGFQDKVGTIRRRRGFAFSFVLALTKWPILMAYVYYSLLVLGLGVLPFCLGFLFGIFSHLGVFFFFFRKRIP